MPISNGDVITAVAQLSYSGVVDVQNKFTYQITDVGAADDDDMMTFVAESLELIYADLEAIMPPEFIFENIHFFNIIDNAPIGDRAWPTFTTGSGANDSLSPTQSVFVFGRTGLSNVLGRKWFPGSGEQQQVDGFWAGGAVTAIGQTMQSYISNLSDGVSGLDMDAGVARFDEDGIFQSFREFTGGVASLACRARKSREFGAGS